MDGIKATDKKDSIAHFLNDKAIRTNPFGDNLSGARMYLRAEKIVAAVYLVTRHISENEPSRVHAREATIGLLQSLLSLRDEMRVSGSHAVTQAYIAIRKLMSLIRVLSIGGNLSMANAEILIDALDDLGSLLNASQKTALSESVVLSREDFLGATKTSGMHDYAEGSSKGHSRRSIKDVRKRIGEQSDTNHKGRRAENILGVLGANGKLGIKDIAAHLPEYSEKMIQRELKDLVANGKARKSGSKRWSMYTLAQQ